MTPGTKRWARAAVALLSTLAMTYPLGCAHEIEVHAALAPDVRIDHYRYFAFALGDDPLLVGFEETARSHDVRQRIEAQTQSTLEALGYAKADTADVLVTISVGSRERKVFRPTPIPRVTPSRSSGWFIENEEADIAEGAFVIDLFDAGSKLLVFHGGARAGDQSRQAGYGAPSGGRRSCPRCHPSTGAYGPLEPIVPL